MLSLISYSARLRRTFVLENEKCFPGRIKCFWLKIQNGISIQKYRFCIINEKILQSL